MADETPASWDLNRIRKEVEAMRDELERVGEKVDGVDEKFARSNATQLSALAAALSGEGAKNPMLLYGFGMKVPDIARIVGISENAVRIQLSRAGVTKRRTKASAKAKPAKKPAAKKRG
jgi:DNA-directed RNA polymerase specialized sigma24 family protein